MLFTCFAQINHVESSVFVEADLEGWREEAEELDERLEKSRACALRHLDMEEERAWQLEEMGRMQAEDPFVGDDWMWILAQGSVEQVREKRRKFLASHLRKVERVRDAMLQKRKSLEQSSDILAQGSKKRRSMKMAEEMEEHLAQGSMNSSSSSTSAMGSPRTPMDALRGRVHGSAAGPPDAQDEPTGNASDAAPSTVQYALFVEDHVIGDDVMSLKPTTLKRVWLLRGPFTLQELKEWSTDITSNRPTSIDAQTTAGIFFQG